MIHRDDVSFLRRHLNRDTIGSLNCSGFPVCPANGLVKPPANDINPYPVPAITRTGAMAAATAPFVANVSEEVAHVAPEESTSRNH
ncbi:hypothetical protein [Arthrobacter sp. OAP107]|uniref:hypothetical protein n=1 Tax=Arthrobacter sp. OAP107 TaxID=3156445 RepID=UPI00339B1767